VAGSNAVAVNLSPVHALRNRGFVNTVTRTLAASGLPARVSSSRSGDVLTRT